MANGPHCADVAQRYILQMMEATTSEDEFEDLIDPSRTYNGIEEWSTGEVFEDSVLKSFDTGESDLPDEPDYGFRALDQIYGALRTTPGAEEEDRDKRLEGLRALDIGWDTPYPEGSKTWWKWKSAYREAGLIDDEENVTDEGRVFLDTDPRGYRFYETSVENIGEVYHELSTRGYGSTEADNGTRIQALFLYGAGLNHAEVSEQLEVAESTIRQSAYNLQDLGILAGNCRLTPEGFEFASMVIDQMDKLEEATRQRVAEEYGGDWSQVDPQEFGGNQYMAGALKPDHH